jgi:hypothetical protein
VPNIAREENILECEKWKFKGCEIKFVDHMTCLREKTHPEGSEKGEKIFYQNVRKINTPRGGMFGEDNNKYCGIFFAFIPGIK